MPGHFVHSRALQALNPVFFRYFCDQSLIFVSGGKNNGHKLDSPPKFGPLGCLLKELMKEEQTEAHWANQEGSICPLCSNSLYK